MLQRVRIAFGVMLFLTSVATAQDRNTFKVGTATAERGQKVTGTIEVPRLAILPSAFLLW